MFSITSDDATVYAQKESNDFKWLLITQGNPSYISLHTLHVMKLVVLVETFLSNVVLYIYI